MNLGKESYGNTDKKNNTANAWNDFPYLRDSIPFFVMNVLRSPGYQTILSNKLSQLPSMNADKYTLLDEGKVIIALIPFCERSQRIALIKVNIRSEATKANMNRRGMTSYSRGIQ